MRRVCVFDVNETLLDLSALDSVFERLFGDASVRAMWFLQLLQCALVGTVTGKYTNFGATGMAALDMVAARHGVELSASDRQTVAQGMRTLPAHPDALDALTRLDDAGLRLAALTNSTAEVARVQLTNAGLVDRFEQVLSADDAKRLKPAPEPYRMAGERLGVSVGQLRLVAAHAWDVTGAIRAGCAAAFVARPGMVLDPIGETPEIVGSGLSEVADRILATDR